MTPALSVIIPCFNEGDRLPSTFAVIRAFITETRTFREGELEWIFVDDGSSDGTGRILEQLSGTAPGVRVLSLPGNRGKGAAIRAGDRIASAPLRAFTDCDLATPLTALEEARRLFDAREPDLVIASRHTPWSELTVPQPWPRRVAGRLFSFVMAHFHRSAFTDTQCGFKAWSRQFSEAVIQRLEDPGWSFDLEIIARAEAQRASILELPVSWSDGDDSKVRAVRDGLAMLREGIGYWLRFTPRVLPALGLAVAVVCVFQALDGRNDFLIYHEAWRATALRQFDALYTPERLTQGGYSSSPLFAVLGVPIGLLSPEAATAVWVVVQFALLGAMLILLKRWTRYQLGQISLSVALWVTFLVALLNDVLGQFQNGNVSLPIFVLCLMAGYSVLFGHRRLSAFWLGVAINIKVFPVFLLGLAILRRDWRYLGWVAGFLALFALAPALYLGWNVNWELHREFFIVLGDYGAENDFGRESLQSLPSALFRLAGGIGADPKLALLGGQIAVAGAATAVWWRFRHVVASSWIVVFSFFLALTAQFVPSSLVNHMGFFYAPLLLLTMHGWARERRWPYSGALVFFVLTYSLSTEAFLGKPTNNLLEVWSLPTLGIWVFLAAAFLFWHRVLPDAADTGTRPPALPHLR